MGVGGEGEAPVTVVLQRGLVRNWDRLWRCQCRVCSFKGVHLPSTCDVCTCACVCMCVSMCICVMCGFMCMFECV